MFIYFIKGGILYRIRSNQVKYVDSLQEFRKNLAGKAPKDEKGECNRCWKGRISDDGSWWSFAESIYDIYTQRVQRRCLTWHLCKYEVKLGITEVRCFSCLCDVFMHPPLHSFSPLFHRFQRAEVLVYSIIMASTLPGFTKFWMFKFHADFTRKHGISRENMVVHANFTQLHARGF